MLELQQYEKLQKNYRKATENLQKNYCSSYNRLKGSKIANLSGIKEIQWYLDITYSDITNSVLNLNSIKHKVVILLRLTNSCYNEKISPGISRFTISGVAL